MDEQTNVQKYRQTDKRTD